MMSWPQASVLAGGLAVTGGALRVTRHRVAAAFFVEACLIATLYAFWQLLGELSVMETTHALARAEWIKHVESAMWLPSERSVQDLVLGHPWVVQFANLYYAGMHFGIMGVFLVWLFARHRDRYAGVRTTIALATLGCLLIQLIPVAPPRLLGGFVDTAQTYGQSVYGGNFADELSAMPSVHVMWAVAVGWYAWRIGRGRWRWLGPLHAVLTIWVVVATGNHWWLDGIVGVAVLVACAGLRIGAVRAWQAWRRRPAESESPEPVPVAAPV